MYEAVNCLSMWHCLPPQLIMKVCTLVYKVYCAYAIITFDKKPTISYALIASLFVSCVSVVFDAWMLMKASAVRAKFYNSLMDRLNAATPDDMQYQKDCEQLAKHFQLGWDMEKRQTKNLEASEWDKLFNPHAKKLHQNDECISCGRYTPWRQQKSDRPFFLFCCCFRKHVRKKRVTPGADLTLSACLGAQPRFDSSLSAQLDVAAPPSTQVSSTWHEHPLHTTAMNHVDPGQAFKLDPVIAVEPLRQPQFSPLVSSDMGNDAELDRRKSEEAENEETNQKHPCGSAPDSRIKASRQCEDFS